LKELDELINKLENIEITNEQSIPLMEEILEKKIDMYDNIIEIIDELINISPLITDAPTYIINNSIKYKQLGEITKIFIEIGKDMQKIKIESNNKSKEISAIIDKKKKEFDELELAINTCLNCEHNSLNCKDVCENI